MKILKLSLGFLFLLFAIAQFNDADPWFWVSLYGFVGALFLISVYRKVSRWFAMVGLLIAVVWMAFILPDFINWIREGMPTITGSMKAESPHIELVREFLGLLIAGGACFFLFLQLSKQESSAAAT